jgi:hypothetical protein
VNIAVAMKTFKTWKKMMNLYLRKVVHPQPPPTPKAHDNYRIVLKRDGDEFEIGSIDIQHGAAWAWGIGTAIPMSS